MSNENISHRLGIKAEAFPLPYCNSDSKIIQVILKFNLLVLHFALAKNYAALNKEKVSLYYAHFHVSKHIGSYINKSLDDTYCV